MYATMSRNITMKLGTLPATKRSFPHNKRLLADVTAKTKYKRVIRPRKYIRLSVNVIVRSPT